MDTDRLDDLTVSVPCGTLRTAASTLRDEHGYSQYTVDEIEEAAIMTWETSARALATEFVGAVTGPTSHRLAFEDNLIWVHEGHYANAAAAYCRTREPHDISQLSLDCPECGKEILAIVNIVTDDVTLFAACNCDSDGNYYIEQEARRRAQEVII